MNKSEFFEKLKNSLSGMPEAEKERAIQYYKEYFEDSIESGKTEREILDELDDIDKIAEDIRAEFAFKKAQKKPTAKNTGKLIAIILLALFSAPITLPLAIAALVVMIAIIVALISVVLALAAVAIGILIGAGGLVFIAPAGAPIFGSVILFIGIAMLLGLLIYYTAKGCIYIIIKMCRAIYSGISKKTKQGADAT